MPQLVANVKTIFSLTFVTLMMCPKNVVAIDLHGISYLAQTFGIVCVFVYVYIYLCMCTLCVHLCVYTGFFPDNFRNPTWLCMYVRVHT